MTLFSNGRTLSYSRSLDKHMCTLVERERESEWAVKMGVKKRGRVKMS